MAALLRARGAPKTHSPSLHTKRSTLSSLSSHLASNETTQGTSGREPANSEARTRGASAPAADSTGSSTDFSVGDSVLEGMGTPRTAGRGVGVEMGFGLATSGGDS